MAGHAAEIDLCPPPQDIKQLHCFLGTVNFYHCFLPNCRQVLCPLTDLLEGGGVQDVGMDLLGTGGFPECKAPPGRGGTPPTSRPTNFLLPLMPPILISAA
jgi:hypothetical protein